MITTLLLAVLALILAVPCACIETALTNWLDGGDFHV